jgi:hypothetical protein
MSGGERPPRAIKDPVARGRDKIKERAESLS